MIIGSFAPNFKTLQVEIALKRVKKISLLKISAQKLHVSDINFGLFDIHILAVTIYSYEQREG